MSTHSTSTDFPQCFSPLSASCHWKPTRYWGQRVQWHHHFSEMHDLVGERKNTAITRQLTMPSYIHEALQMNDKDHVCSGRSEEHSPAGQRCKPRLHREWEVYMRPNTRGGMERIAGRESRLLKRQAACKQARMGWLTISRRHGENAGLLGACMTLRHTGRGPARPSWESLNPWATDLGEQVLGNKFAIPRTTCTNCSGWSCMYRPSHPDFHTP